MDTYDIYELMIIPPNKKGEMIVEELYKPEPNIELVKDLIELGANIDWQDNYGRSVLHWSILHYNTWNNNPNTWNRIYPEIPAMLIEAEADVNIQDGGGWTALHVCAFFHFPDIVRMLINAGADKTIQDNKGRFPYELAIPKELYKILEV